MHGGESGWVSSKYMWRSVVLFSVCLVWRSVEESTLWFPIYSKTRWELTNEYHIGIDEFLYWTLYFFSKVWKSSLSPNGSLRNTCDAKPDLMYENKCRAPTSYNALTYYSISHYYVTQLLSEMFVYECRERLFTCWSVQFMAVFHVRFDQEIWVFTHPDSPPCIRSDCGWKLSRTFRRNIEDHCIKTGKLFP
jgi:hypothetical protein